jgi:hypothetical protein
MRSRELLADRARRVQSLGPVARRHPDVYDRQVRTVLADQAQQPGSVVSLADDVEPRSLEQASYSFAKQRVIVRQNDVLACFAVYVGNHPVTPPLDIGIVDHITGQLSQVTAGHGGGVMGATGTHDPRAADSLTRRTVVVSALLSAIIGSAFFLLALAIDALRSSESRANHALEILVAANRLERLAVDVQTTQRGYIITGESRFLRRGTAHRTISSTQPPPLSAWPAQEARARAARRGRRRRPGGTTSGITRSRW